MGKSNLLDALYTLSFSKSFSGLTDAMLVKRGEEFALLSAIYFRHGLDEELTLGLRPPRRKVLKRGGKEYGRLSEHIGSFPLVLLSPADNALVDVGAEERRRFLDQIISQNDPRYLEALGRYATALRQRNALLREGSADRQLFLALELQLDRAGSYLTAARRKAVGELLPIFGKYYRAIAATDEGVAMTYRSGILDSGCSLTELLAHHRRPSGPPGSLPGADQDHHHGAAPRPVRAPVPRARHPPSAPPRRYLRQTRHRPRGPHHGAPR